MSNYSLEIQTAVAAEFAKGWGYKAVHNFWPEIPLGTLRDWGRHFKQGRFPYLPKAVRKAEANAVATPQKVTQADRDLVMNFILSQRRPVKKTQWIQGELDV